jgi:hypothetical protein
MLLITDNTKAMSRLKIGLYKNPMRFWAAAGQTFPYLA